MYIELDAQHCLWSWCMVWAQSCFATEYDDILDVIVFTTLQKQFVFGAFLFDIFTGSNPKRPENVFVCFLKAGARPMQNQELLEMWIWTHTGLRLGLKL